MDRSVLVTCCCDRVEKQPEGGGFKLLLAGNIGHLSREGMTLEFGLGSGSIQFTHLMTNHEN